MGVFIVYYFDFHLSCVGHQSVHTIDGSFLSSGDSKTNKPGMLRGCNTKIYIMLNMLNALEKPNTNMGSPYQTCFSLGILLRCLEYSAFII